METANTGLAADNDNRNNNDDVAIAVNDPEPEPAADDFARPMLPRGLGVPSSTSASAAQALELIINAYAIQEKYRDGGELHHSNSYSSSGSNHGGGIAALREASLDEALAAGSDSGYAPHALATSAPAMMDTEKIGSKDSDKEESPQQQQQQYWIDVEVPGLELEALLPRLRETVLNPALLSLQYDANLLFLRHHLSDWRQWQTPQVLPLPNAALVVMRILHGTDQDPSKGGKEGPYGVRHAAALCLPHQVITVTSSSSSLSSTPISTSTTASTTTTDRGLKQKSLRVASEDTIHKMLQARSQQLLEASVSGCVLLWLTFHCSRTSTATHHLRETIYRMAETMTRNVADLKLDDIVACKDRLLRLSSVAEEQNECIQAIVEGGDTVCDSITFDHSTTLQGSLNVLKQSAMSTEKLVFRLEKRLTDLEKSYDSHQQERINYRLNVLTILSAIFLPLTLLSGMYGMNWSNMPELDSENGYFYLLGAMGAIAIALVLYFWRAGWWS